MADYNNHNLQYASTLVLIISLVLNSYNPLLAQAQIINAGGVRVDGRLCCTETGTCTLGAAPVPEVNVTVSCINPLGLMTTVRTGLTDQDGVFNITLLFRSPLFVDIMSIPCTVFTRLPLNNTVCPLLNDITGSLNATLLYRRGKILSSVLGSILCSVITAWIRVIV